MEKGCLAIFISLIYHDLPMNNGRCSANSCGVARSSGAQSEEGGTTRLGGFDFGPGSTLESEGMTLEHQDM